MKHVLYINGLGNGKNRQRDNLMFGYLKRRGLLIRPASVNWFDGSTFEDLLQETTRQARDILDGQGELVIVGASAGVALALNVFAALHDITNVTVVCICGPVGDPVLSFWDPRTLDFRTHRMNRRLDNHYVSVLRCQNVTIPALTKTEKSHIIVVRQLLDFTVPRKSMTIRGVKTTIVPAFGHMAGILTGLLRLPKIVTQP